LGNALDEPGATGRRRTGRTLSPAHRVFTVHSAVTAITAAFGTPLPDDYHRVFRWWFAFAFRLAAVLAIFWLMIVHPAIPYWD
jgi:uncharacterized membrane protein